VAINLPLKKLTQWQKIAFSAALLERMLPNYQMFAETAEFGDFSVLRNQLDLIWQRLNKQQKVTINFDAQLVKLEEQIPDPLRYDFFGVYPALDAAMGLMALLQAMQDNETEGFDSVTRLSENSVHFYVELCLVQAQENEEAEISQTSIAEHPLVIWEKAMQNDLFDCSLTARENKSGCEALRSIALAQGLSSLGIECL
jgi:hypothetical protein